MSTEIQSTDKTEGADSSTKPVSGVTVTGYAVFGCLVAGTIGIFKAVTSEGLGSAACIFASVVAFGTVCYIYFRKD